MCLRRGLKTARLGLAGDICRLLIFGDYLLQGCGATGVALGISNAFLLERDRRSHLLQAKKELDAVDQITFPTFVGLNDRSGVVGRVGLFLCNQLKKITVGGKGLGLLHVRFFLDLEIA